VAPQDVLSERRSKESSKQSDACAAFGKSCDAYSTFVRMSSPLTRSTSERDEKCDQYCRRETRRKKSLERNCACGRKPDLFHGGHVKWPALMNTPMGLWV
jgi:hypothetical protein